MTLKKLKVKTLEHFDKNFSLPHYETKDAAGADLRACLGGEGETLVIPKNSRVLIPTGLAFDIPSGFEIQIRPRSGLSLKTNLLIVNSPGTIDADYKGEVKIIMGNFGERDEVITHGDRIAQMVVAPVIQVEFIETDTLTESERGDKGFGSTGRK